MRESLDRVGRTFLSDNQPPQSMWVGHSCPTEIVSDPRQPWKRALQGGVLIRQSSFIPRSTDCSPNPARTGRARVQSCKNQPHSGTPEPAL